MTQYDLGQVVGADGSDGDDGVGISSITKTGSSGLVDTYTITYTDSTTSTFTVTNGADGTDGSDGADGDDGVGISSISKTSTSGLVDTYTITYTDSSTSTFTVTNGAKGDTGNTGATGKGISSITKTGTSGLVDTYTITYSDSTTSTFTVTNGSDATVTIQTSWGSTTSDSKVPSEKLTKDNLDGKVDKVTGKGLSTEDYTSTEKTKLSGIETGANNYTHPSSKQCNYAPDLSNYVQKSSTTGLIKNDGSIDASSYLTTGTASSTYIPKTDIVDNLTTSDATKVLSAKQGKALADLIGDAITYINQ